MREHVTQCTSVAHLYAFKGFTWGSYTHTITNTEYWTPPVVYLEAQKYSYFFHIEVLHQLNENTHLWLCCAKKHGVAFSGCDVTVHCWGYKGAGVTSCRTLLIRFVCSEHTLLSGIFSEAETTFDTYSALLGHLVKWLVIFIGLNENNLLILYRSSGGHWKHWTKLVLSALRSTVHKTITPLFLTRVCLTLWLIRAGQEILV